MHGGRSGNSGGSGSGGFAKRRLYVHMRERAREEKAVKERLRQLRREADADREPEELPLLTEEDAGEVLDEAQVEVEGALVVPDGFKISDPPSEEALIVSKPPSAAAKALEGRRILRKWEGFGWCSGIITKANDDLRRSIGGDKVNFFAHYEIDGEDEDDVPHVLELGEYRTTDDAEYDSWLLLEPLESPGEEALDGEMEAGAAEAEPAAEVMEVEAA
jgi:hypothetical protein